MRGIQNFTGTGKPNQTYNITHLSNMDELNDIKITVDNNELKPLENPGLVQVNEEEIIITFDETSTIKPKLGAKIKVEYGCDKNGLITDIDIMNTKNKKIISWSEKSPAVIDDIQFLDYHELTIEGGIMTHIIHDIKGEITSKNVYIKKDD